MPDKRHYYGQVVMPASRFWLILLGLIVFAGFSAVIGLVFGSVIITPGQLVHLTDVLRHIVLDIRLPRLLAAFIVGACLSASGAGFQGVLQNPMADPYILGVSSGAGLGTIAVLLMGGGSLLILPLGAFLGALGTLLIILFLVKKTKGQTIFHYILIGLMINAFFSSVGTFILFLSGRDITSILYWLMGHLGYLSVNALMLIYILSGVLLTALLFFSYQINIISLGDKSALALGVDVKKVRIYVFLIAGFLTALAVAAGGIIGFVGLVVPHIIRKIIGDDFRVVILFSFIFGGAFLILTDMAARTLLPFMDLPAGIITSFIGAPFFLWLLVSSSKKNC
ncbi:FecCD family ABC transporter permease [Thermoproteota archaeon]